MLFCAVPAIYLVVMSFQRVDMFDIMTLSRVRLPGLHNYAGDAGARGVASGAAQYGAVRAVLGRDCNCRSGLRWRLFFKRSNFPGASSIRGLLLAGWIMPGLVVGAIWKWIFAGDVGVLNAILRALHLPSHLFWLSDPHLSLFAVVIANIWLGIPFNMVLLSVGLAAIPAELYEAASIDGAGPIRTFLSDHTAVDAGHDWVGCRTGRHSHAAAVRSDFRADGRRACQHVERGAVLVLAVVVPVV